MDVRKGKTQEELRRGQFWTRNAKGCLSNNNKKMLNTTKMSLFGSQNKSRWCQDIWSFVFIVVLSENSLPIWVCNICRPRQQMETGREAPSWTSISFMAEAAIFSFCRPLVTYNQLGPLCRDFRFDDDPRLLSSADRRGQKMSQAAKMCHPVFWNIYIKLWLISSIHFGTMTYRWQEGKHMKGGETINASLMTAVAHWNVTWLLDLSPNYWN